MNTKQFHTTVMSTPASTARMKGWLGFCREEKNLCPFLALNPDSLMVHSLPRQYNERPIWSPTRVQNVHIYRPGYSSQLPLNCSEVNSKIHKPQCDCLFSLGGECGRCGKVEPKRKRKAQTRVCFLSLLV